MLGCELNFKGWASAELTTKLVPLWVGAKGIEFDWKYTQMSLDSNISLVSELGILQLYLCIDHGLNLDSHSWFILVMEIIHNKATFAEVYCIFH